MSRRSWFWSLLSGTVAVLAGALAYAGLQQAGASLAGQAGQKGFVCPITGEVLPCPQCCPLREKYVCPITGEELPCPHCCPLNQAK